MKISWLKIIGIAVAIYIVGALVVFAVFWLRGQANPTLPSLSQYSASDDLQGQGTGQVIPAWSPTLGTKGAPLTIIEFADFSCPFCKAAVQPLRQFVQAHPQDVYLVFRNFPLTTVHPLAFDLAQAGLCAHDQGKFWALHDKFYQYQESLDKQGILQQAQAVGLDMPAFNSCVNNNRYQEIIGKDLADARAFGARGTPTWLVNGVKLEGVITLAQWEKLLQSVQ